MRDENMENKERDREIARNERMRRIIGGIRISSWAIAVAVIVGLAVGWMLRHYH